MSLSKTSTIFGISSPRTLFADSPAAGTLRGFPVNAYIVYYRVIGSQTVISRVIHGMRDQRTAYRND